MLGYTPPKPAYWKALLVTAFPVALVAWSLQFIHLKIPVAALTVLTLGFWFAVSAIVHSRVLNDWRSQYEMNLMAFEREVAVTPAVQIKDE